VISPDGNPDRENGKSTLVSPVRTGSLPVKSAARLGVQSEAAE
jgi:hypothetical protein